MQELWVFFLKSLQNLIWSHFSGEPEMNLAKAHPSDQYLIKAVFKFGFKNFGTGLMLDWKD